jgi:fibronectin-binding autotransporter adhesin
VKKTSSTFDTPHRHRLSTAGRTLLIAGLAAAALRAPAALLTWDADPATPLIEDGSGTWDTTGTNWWDGSAHTNWNNAAPDSAIFGAGAGTGTVFVGEALSIGDLTFSAPYLLDGGTLSLSQPTTLRVDADAEVRSVLAGPGGLVVTGAAVLTLSANNTFTGALRVAQGTVRIAAAFLRGHNGLTIAADAAVEASSNLQISVGAANPSIGVTGAGVLRLSSTGSNSNSPDLYFGPNHTGNSFWGARVGTTLDLGDRQRFVFGKTGHNGVGTYGVAGADCQFAGSIIGSGGLTLIGQNDWNAGMGVPFCLNGTNTFSGPVDIRRGSLYLGSDGALTNANVLKFNAPAGQVARFFLWGRTATVADLQSPGAGAALIADGAVGTPAGVGPGTLRVFSSNDTTFAGSLVDFHAEYGTPAGTQTARLHLVKSGPAQLTLTGTNGFSGSITVEAGTLRLSGAGNLGGASYGGSISNDGRLVVDSSITHAWSSVISGTGSLIKTGSGTLILEGDSLFVGSVVVSAGVLRVHNPTGSGTGYGTVTVRGSGLLTGSGAVSGLLRVATGGRLAAGRDGIGLLTVDSLDLQAGCTNQVQIAADGLSNDLVRVTSPGGLTLTGCAVDLVVAETGLPWVPASTNAITFDFLEIAGVVDPTLFTVARPAAGVSYTFQTNATHVQVRLQLQHYVWAGAAAGANWSEAANWESGVAPGSYQSLQFGAPLQTINTNDLPAATPLALAFMPGSDSFTLRGQPVNLIGDLVNESANEQRIELPLVLDGGRRGLTAAAGNLFFTGPLGQTNGAWGIDVSGPGVVTLAGSNHYNASSLTISNSGTLVVDALNLQSTRVAAIGTNCILRSTGLVAFAAPPGGDMPMVAGPGIWEMRGEVTSATLPDLFYSPAGLLGNYGAQVTASIDVGPAGRTRHIRGNSNRNDFYRYYGDWQSWGGIMGAADLAFYGAPQGSYEMTFTLAGNNSAFTGNITLQRGDLVLYNNQALTAANDVHLSPGAGENAYLHPWGTFTLQMGSLSSSGAGNARVIGHYTQTFTVNQDQDATFAGLIVSENGVFNLAKRGPATLRLTGANTYNGTTLVADGLLQVGDGGTSGTLGTGAVTIDTALAFVRSNDLTLPNALSGTGTLVQAGTGTLILPGTNVLLAGLIEVSNGTLAVQGAIAASGLTISSAGTLGGTGDIAAAVIAEGSIVAGWNGAGALGITGDLTMGPTAALQFALAGPGVCTRLEVGGLAFLNGTLEVVTTNGYTPASGDSFTLLTSLAPLDSFAATALPALAPGLSWEVQVTASSVELSVVGSPLATGYDAWAAGITNSLTNFNESATGDGYPNLLKYATGSSPSNSDTLARLYGAHSNGILQALFNRNTNALDVTLWVEGGRGSLTGLVWTGWATNHLGSWGNATNVLEISTSTPARVTVRDPDPALSNWVIRLRVTSP